MNILSEMKNDAGLRMRVKTVDLLLIEQAMLEGNESAHRKDAQRRLSVLVAKAQRVEDSVRRKKREAAAAASGARSTVSGCTCSCQNTLLASRSCWELCSSWLDPFSHTRRDQGCISQFGEASPSGRWRHANAFMRIEDAYRAALVYVQQRQVKFNA
jgi:hypothetical protein